MTLSYEEGGECTRLSYAKFVKSEGEVDGSSTAVVGTEGGGDRSVGGELLSCGV